MKRSPASRPSPQVPHPHLATSAGADRHQGAVHVPTATAETHPLVLKRLAAGHPGPQVPDPHRAILAAADHHRDAVHLLHCDRC